MPRRQPCRETFWTHVNIENCLRQYKPSIQYWLPFYDRKNHSQFVVQRHVRKLYKLLAQSLEWSQRWFVPENKTIFLSTSHSISRIVAITTIIFFRYDIRRKIWLWVLDKVRLDAIWIDWCLMTFMLLFIIFFIIYKFSKSLTTWVEISSILAKEKNNIKMDEKFSDHCIVLYFKL